MTHLDAHTALRSWCWWFDEGGKIWIRSTGSDNSVELRKRRWKTRPDRVFFRYRNAERTRKYFRRVRTAFDDSGTSYELELTPKRRSPRAIVIPHDPYDVMTPQMLLNLAAQAFAVSGHGAELVDLFCSAWLREDRHNPPMAFVVPHGTRTDAEKAGYQLGKRLRRIVNKAIGSDD